YGPHSRDVLMKLFGIDIRQNVDEDDLHTASHGGEPVMIVATSHFDVPGFDLMLPAARVAPLWKNLAATGARPAGLATLDVLRIEAGAPQWGAELTDGTIPLEAGLKERAISQTKGCYTGQEVIVRILHRGHVNWVLRRVLMGDAAAPAQQTALVERTGGKKVGRITSSAWSPKYQQTIGLAYVRREIEPGTELHLESTEGPLVKVTPTSDLEPVV
ncbi:MAG: glycine cleavage T C-terminal barrel domain-containing protein, partial [Longimicrobiales bacterium]